MTEQLPPKVIIFQGINYNSLFFSKINGGLTYEQATGLFLEYPNAQGNETTNYDFNVNGTLNAGGQSNFNNDANFNDIAYFNKNILMNATSAIDRQISTGYLNLIPITGGPVATGTTLYQNTNVAYIDNNVNDGALAVAFNTPAGVQKITNTYTWATSQFNVPILINNIGNYLQFPDGTQQTTAFTSATNKTYSIEYTTSQNITIPANCIGIGIRLVAQGGYAGNSTDGNGGTWNCGGSGGGGSTVISNGIIPITSGSLTLNILNSSGGYVELLYSSVSIGKSFNGNNGANATTTGGLGALQQANGIGNTNYSTFSILSGSAGSVGLTGASYQNCSQIPSTAGRPSYYPSFIDGSRGTGQRYSAVGQINQCPTPTVLNGGIATITYYLK